MANDTTITVVGNLTADPELRFTPAGAAVANFTIASTPRYFDKQSNEWKDGETLFVRSSIWREKAEEVADLLAKGARVIAQGNLKSRSFQDKEGNNRTSWELDVQEIGAAIKGKKNTPQSRPTPDQTQQWGGGQSDPWTGQPSGNTGQFGGSWDTSQNSQPAF